MRYNFLENRKFLFFSLIVETILIIFLILISAYCIRRQYLSLEELSKTATLRYESYLLADQLRHSSDDLTRMVRTYVGTGESRYEDYYWDILAIRNGKKVRPINYERIYWDLITTNKTTPTSLAPGRKVSLEQLMKEAGFTKQELQLLEKGKEESDKLVALEQIAMNAMKGKFQDETGAFTVSGKPDQKLAWQIVFGHEYHEAKKAIMEPINEFYEVIAQRTTKGFASANFQIHYHLMIFIGIFVASTITGIILLITMVRYQKLMVDSLVRHREKLHNLVEKRTKELTDSNNRFQSLSDAAFEGVVISDKGVILEVNNATSTMFGYSPQALISMNAIDLVTPENRDMVQNNILAENENSYEAHGLKSDGSPFPIEIRGKMFSYKGQKVRVTTIRDLTEKKAAEDEVRTLRGLIPVCTTCKKIRDDKGVWNRMEKYISEHSEAEFSHSCCNDCIRELYPDIADEVIGQLESKID